MHNIFIYIGYIAGALFLLFGTVLIFTNLFENWEFRFRITLGVVLMLYGIYRIVMTKYKSYKKNIDENE